jgi:ABC-type multidrug transport system ATPase subunit
MLRELTVYENILHSCQVRLPSSWTNREIKNHAATIIKALDLEHVQNTRIGDETTRGISGGQRKRVNIGIELSAVPLSLYLDEPTSGLDSTSALKVCNLLKRISSLGITVVMILHQPRYEIFAEIDDLLLIAPGGRTSYIGPVNEVQEYFISCGHSFPAVSNPADVLMDILSKDKSLPEKWLAVMSAREGGSKEVLDGKAEENLFGIISQ